MGRIATRNVRPSSRPEPLGRVHSTAAVGAVSVTDKEGRAAHGYGPPALGWTDVYPSPIGEHDAAQLRREEAFRARELADLPDTGQPW